MEENEQLTSKYSTGVNINLRVDQLWKDSHLHSRTGRYNQWNLDLDCIWSELARDLKDTNKEKNVYETKQEEFDVFDTEILKYGVIKDEAPSGFKNPTPEMEKARSEHYKILRRKQLFLARLENKLGKGTTWDDDDDDEID